MASDYIMRMIQQFVQAIVSIMRSRKEGQYEQALEQIQEASQRYLSTDIAFFLQYNPDQLLEHFKTDAGCLDGEKSIICGDLLYELAMICADKNNHDESLYLMTMSLNLYMAAIRSDRQFQTREYVLKANEMMEKIDVLSLSDMMLENLIRYREFVIEKEITIG